MPKLSELVQIRLIDRKVRASAAANGGANSVFDFTDLTPLCQDEIDKYWPFEGSALERAIALRLATRTALETLKAISAKWSGSNGPCHKCGKNKHNGCSCLVYCDKCWAKYYKDTPHTCDTSKPVTEGSFWDKIAF